MRSFFSKTFLVFALLLSLPLQAAVEVTDYLNRVVRLEQPAQRIVALAPHIVENAYSAGAGDQLAAAVDYSDYPPAALELPKLGSHNAVSMEQILALEPDLVLVWGSGNGETMLGQLERLGLTVYVDEPRKMEDVARSVRAIGTLAGTSAAAEQAATRYLAKLEHLKSQYKQAEPITALYQIWNQPLQTLNGEHLVSDVIQLCGGRNIYRDAIPLAPKINMESVLARDPQMIVASGTGEERPDWLDEWKQRPGLTAVKHDNLFFVPPDIIQRHTVRIAQGAELFCEHIENARQRLTK